MYIIYIHDTLVYIIYIYKNIIYILYISSIDVHKIRLFQTLQTFPSFFLHGFSQKSLVSHIGLDVSESIKGRILQLRLVILLLQLVNVPYNKTLGPELINDYQPFRLPAVVSKLVTNKFLGYRLHPLTRIDHLSQPCDSKCQWMILVLVIGGRDYMTP